MRFPDPELSDSHGLVYVGGDLNPETLESAYSQGIFPWPDESVKDQEEFIETQLPRTHHHLLWFCPPQRGVLFFDEFKIPRSVQKLFNKKPFDLTLDRSFDQVIENCAKTHGRFGGTWILPEMVEAYKELHRKGKAMSVEAWQKGELVGGLYGVLIKGVFSGESMFFKESGASKLCLVYLVRNLKSWGHRWIDIQMVTSVLHQFGGRLVPRKEFLELLKQRHKQWKKDPAG